MTYNGEENIFEVSTFCVRVKYTYEVSYQDRPNGLGHETVRRLMQIDSVEVIITDHVIDISSMLNDKDIKKISSELTLEQS